MPSHRRVLAVIDVDHRGREAAREAWAVARSQGASFGLGHIADWGHGLDGGGFPALVPAEVEECLAVIVRRRLATIATQIGVPAASVMVSFPGYDRGVADFARGWQPDLVVVSARHDHGIAGKPRLAVPGWECDVAVVDPPARGFLPRLLDRAMRLCSVPAVRLDLRRQREYHPGK